ncbi:MAG: class I SAM-dependent methyltransferase [Dysgonamonadaceae bacterium]|jgi:predicted O-methyltransferase YrrM|nr:class I SAM-dependent methyltransferase [Dysgonamonadaceae bacterium]
MDLLQEYIERHIDAEPPQLAELYRKANIRLLNPRMVAGHTQGRLLKMLVRIFNPKRVLEIGTFTGYATLCMAEGLRQDGEIHTIEIDDELEEFILEEFEKSPLKHRIHLHIGNALDVIPKLEGMFDMAFIDGDKRQYCASYEALFEKISDGGLIVADNTLWGGKVVQQPHPADLHTSEILRFNSMIAADTRVEKVILPIRDGLTIIYKIPNDTPPDPSKSFP